MLIESFGFKHGIPADADFVFDLRCLPNPYWSADLRGLTGLDNEVVDFLHSHDSFGDMAGDIAGFLDSWIPHFENTHRSYLTVAIGCTGGRHRSVAMVEILAKHLRQHHEPVLVRHNTLADHRLHSN